MAQTVNKPTAFRQLIVPVLVFAAACAALLLAVRADNAAQFAFEAESGDLVTATQTDGDGFSGGSFVTLNGQLPTPTPTPDGSCPASPVLPDATLHSCIFNESFDGTILNAALWGNRDTHQWTSYDPATDTRLSWVLAKNAVLADGQLRLQAIREVNNGVPWSAAEIATTTFDSADGNIDRDPLFKYRYGYLEARAKLPGGNGMVSALWLKHLRDQPFSEYEIIEFVGANPHNQNHPNHFYRSESDPAQVVAAPGGTDAWDYGTDLTADFHTYGLLWQEDKMIWYLDGREIKRLTDTKAIFHEEMALWLSLYVFGEHNGVNYGYHTPPDATTPSPSEFIIDYVRIWQ